MKDLPVKEVHCQLHGDDCRCADCGSEMKQMGKKIIREEVCFVPARLYKKRYISYTYACDCHDESIEAKPIRCAETPKAPIQRSFAGASVLAEVFHQKYVLSIPCYRQVSEWARYGLSVSDKTLSNWIMIASHDWLRPIYDLLRKELVLNQVLHADETPYQILNRADGKPATSQARVWLFRTIKNTEHPIAYYHADLTRERAVATTILEGFKGYLHCDGYSGYKNIPNLSLVGCWAHVRRKFFEIPGNNGKAQKAVEYCDKIFSFEKTIKGLSPEERQKQRQLVIKPVVEEFFDWLQSFYAMKGKLQTAVMYALNQKVELLRFLEDGNLEASNNLAEQGIRPIAIGRKNYLFSTSMKGATANAMAYTIIETAKANRLNPSKYLNYLFEKLPNTDFIRNPDVLVDFLPWAKSVQETCQ
ncbi:IS66 family transposase [Turicibacter sp. GALT-G1]|uniref:IS66 family transposase n=1 Tax=Turicibacter sp. GALT-G1 TaxID=2951140 RepID=UPI0021D4B331|nr:IS66 family transposase [Turicibacter sp. GALT-G1]MCU7207429.1 IS66 family transposase [Turicibacter sp. GALT-G1]